MPVTDQSESTRSAWETNAYAQARLAWQAALDRAAAWWAAQPARRLAELNDALTKLEDAHAADR